MATWWESRPSTEALTGRCRPAGVVRPVSFGRCRSAGAGRPGPTGARAPAAPTGAVPRTPNRRRGGRLRGVGAGLARVSHCRGRPEGRPPRTGGPTQHALQTHWPGRDGGRPGGGSHGSRAERGSGAGVRGRRAGAGRGQHERGPRRRRPAGRPGRLVPADRRAPGRRPAVHEPGHHPPGQGRLGHRLSDGRRGRRRRVPGPLRVRRGPQGRGPGRPRPTGGHRRRVEPGAPHPGHRPHGRGRHPGRGAARGPGLPRAARERGFRLQPEGPVRRSEEPGDGPERAPNVSLGSLATDGRCDPAYAGQSYGRGSWSARCST